VVDDARGIGIGMGIVTSLYKRQAYPQKSWIIKKNSPEIFGTDKQVSFNCCTNYTSGRLATKNI